MFWLFLVVYPMHQNSTFLFQAPQDMPKHEFALVCLGSLWTEPAAVLWSWPECLVEPKILKKILANPTGKQISRDSFSPYSSVPWGIQRCTIRQNKRPPNQATVRLRSICTQVGAWPNQDNYSILQLMLGWCQLALQDLLCKLWNPEPMISRPLCRTMLCSWPCWRGLCSLATQSHHCCSQCGANTPSASFLSGSACWTAPQIVGCSAGNPGCSKDELQYDIIIYNILYYIVIYCNILKTFEINHDLSTDPLLQNHTSSCTQHNNYLQNQKPPYIS